MVLTGLGCALRPPPRGAGVDARIQHAEGILARYPRHYPAQADLALAFLDKTRQTLDPVWLNKARAAARRSLDIQANHEAFKALAAIEAFAHRFDDSIRWAYLARTTLPDDTEVTSRIVESLLGLGRRDEARRLLVADETAVKDFHTTAALALLARDEGQGERAAAAFEGAARLAAAQGSSELAVWAYAMAAGVWLDAGDLASSEHALSLAAAIPGESVLVRLQRAALLAAAGQGEEASALYAKTLGRHPDAEGYRSAMRLALSIGDDERAREYRDAAERLLLPAIEAGEVYTLGELARLYRDAGIRLERAEQLARENLQHVGDAEAVATLASIRELRRRR